MTKHAGVDLEKLRSFFYLIKEGSYSKASILLNKNRLTLVNHIAEIEKFYKTRLFIKDRRRFVLTEIGEELFNTLQTFLPSLDTSLARILPRERENQSDRLRIFTTTGTIGLFIIHKIKKLLEEQPHLTISIITHHENLDFENSRADVAILQKSKSTAVLQRKIKTVHSRLFASPEYLSTYGVPQSIEDLKNHKLLSYYSDYEGTFGNVDWHINKNMPEGQVRPSQIRANSPMVLFEAACLGLGIVAIDADFELIKRSHLVPVLPNFPAQSFDIYYIVRKNSIQTEAQKRFYEILSAHI